jgi:hypothetical protein
MLLPLLLLLLLLLLLVQTLSRQTALANNQCMPEFDTTSMQHR